MAYQPHLRAVAIGEYRIGDGSPLEIWSCTTNHALGTTNPTDSQLDTAANDVLEAWSGLIHTSQFPDNVVLHECRVAVTDTDNKIPGHVGYSTGSEVRGTATSYLPYSVALAVTLRTPTRGPKGRGRFFLPTPAMSIGSNGRVSGGFISSITADLSTFRTALQTAAECGVSGADTGLTVVASGVAGNILVSGWQVGDVPDTIRSRRNALPENYADVSF
jgi:hypothetical protein